MTLSAEAAPSRRTRVGRLTVLFAAHALGTANITLALAFAPLLQRELGLTTAGFGLAISAYYGAQVIFALPAGWLVDRFGVRHVLTAAHVVMAAGTGLLALAGGPVGFFAAMILCGLGYALVNPATARGVLAWFDPRNRSTAMGVKQTGVPAGAVALATIAALVAEDWRILAGALALVMLVTTLMYLALEPSRATVVPTNILRDLRIALSDRRLATINLATCCYTIALSALLAYFVTFAYEEVRVSAAAASLFLGLVQGASAAGRIGWGILGDRLPGNGRVIGLVACGLLGAAGSLALPFAQSATLLALLALLLGLTVGGFASLAQTHAVESVEPGRTGAAVGYNMLFTTGGSMLGPALFAFFLGLGGYQLSWSLIAAGLVAGALLFRLSAR